MTTIPRRRRDDMPCNGSAPASPPPPRCPPGPPPPAEEEDARDVVRLIRAEGRKAVPLPGDIRNEAFCRKLVADAVAGLGGLDILVNNAGYQQTQSSLADISPEQLDATFKTNVYAMFWITQAALPHLPAGAAIINTASI